MLRRWQWFWAALLAALLAAGCAWNEAGPEAAPPALPRPAPDARLRLITTVRPAVILTLGGFSRREPLAAVLEAMASHGLKGTFMVSERELQRNLANIDLIHRRGYDLGLAVRTREEDTYESLRGQLARAKAILKRRYGVTAQAVRLMGGELTPGLQRAAGDLGLLILGQGLSMVQSKHKAFTDPGQVVAGLFGPGTTSLHRGEIIFLRTDFYDEDTLAAKVLLAVKAAKLDNIAYDDADDSPASNPANDSAYALTDLRTALADKASLYALPVGVAAMPPELRPGYRAFTVTDDNFRQEFRRRYIGNPYVDEYDAMAGFSLTEARLADRQGVIRGAAPRTVFLTFDDWGMDDNINPLLYVLRKHHVTATFFVITRNLPANPNLLRAMAVEGHEIASHTNNHVPMAKRGITGRAVTTVEEGTYAADVAECYRRLAAVVGDVTRPDGTHVLTRFVRPPTLAVSRNPGVRDLLEAGYTFIVSGQSVEDYAQPSLQSLIGALHAGIYKEGGEIRDGAVLVMHMSRTATRTPRALDMLLTANERRPEGDPRKFRVGRLGDYLKEGYDQSQP